MAGGGSCFFADSECAGIDVYTRQIGNILKAIEQGLFTPSTKQRLDELEARKEEILVNIQTAELQKPKLTREQMTAWFEQFRHMVWLRHFWLQF